MKKIILTVGLLFFCFALSAQIEGTSLPSLPSVTTAEMNGAINVNIGSSVFNTDEQRVYRYTTSGWVTNLDNQDLSLVGNVLSLTNDASTVDLSSLTGLGDDLGNHLATQNIRTNGNWLSYNTANAGIYLSNLNRVGINTPTPLLPLDINGDLGFSGRAAMDASGNYLRLNQNNDFTSGVLISNRLRVDGATIINELGEATADFRVETDNLTHAMFVDASTDRIGIGTASPSSLLTIAGLTTTTNFRMTNGAANGYLLQSNATGDASWVNSSTIGSDNQDLSIGAGGVANQSVEIAIVGGNNALVDIRDADSVIGNESVTGLAFDGTTLTLTQDGAPNETVNLSSVSADNIYTDDGTLIADRAVTQNNFDLNFDSNTLVVSGDNDRVGIGTNTPLGKIHVSSINGEDAIFSSSSNTAATDMDLDLYRTRLSGASIAPVQNGDALGGLRFNGLVNASSGVLAPFATSAAISVEMDGAVSSTSAPGKIEFSTTDVGSLSPQERMTIKPNGNIGIGTDTPDAKVDIENGTLRLSDYGGNTVTGTATAILAVEADGDVIEVDANTLDTDDQTLSWTNTDLEISEGNTVDLRSFTNTDNVDAFSFISNDGTTGEKDVFTIEDQDVGGGSQDHSSVFKVVKSGAISTADNGFSLVELVNTGTDPGANKYWISGRKTDEGAPLWGVDITDNDFWSEGGITLGVTGDGSGTYSGGSFSVTNTGQITSTDLSGAGTRMVVADATGVLSTQAVVANSDNQDLSIGAGGVANQSVEVAISGGNNALVDIRDADSVIGNESVTGLAFDGTTLTLTQDGAPNETVNLSSVSADNIYTADGTLTGNRAVTQNNFDLNFDANTLVVSGDNDRVGVGTANPNEKFHLRSGSLYINDEGTGLIVDASTNKRIGFMKYSGREAGIWRTATQDFEIGRIVSGDGSTDVSGTAGNTYEVDIAVSGTGNVGIGVAPSAKLDVNGNARVRTIPASADTDQLVTADANGNLRQVNSLKASKVFYPPSIAIDASSPDPATDRTIDLHAQYIAQFGSPVVSSAGTIPTYAANELDYHVTFADPSVFGNGTTVQNMSVDANGILTYRIFNSPADYNALINVVFVVK